MSNPFLDHPILNSPYAYPARHGELAEHEQPTQKVIEARHHAEFITPISKPKKWKRARAQQAFVFDEAKGSQQRSSNTTSRRSSGRCAA